MSDSLPSTDEFEIQPTDLYSMLECGEPDIRLIDCREVDEYAICKITGYELIPLSRFAEEAPPKLENEDRAIVIYCHHGMRSLQSTNFLRHKGLSKVWSLN